MSTSTGRRPRAIGLLDPAAREEVLAPADLDRLRELVDLDGFCASATELGSRPDLSQVEVLVGGWGTPALDVALLGLLPSLRIVLYTAGSVRHLTTPELWRRGITVVSAAEANNEPVAEFVVATTVLALKGTHRSEAHLRSAHAHLPAHTGLGIYERAVGLVGFGSIARKVAAGLHRFGHEILVWDPYLDDAAAAAAGVHRLDSLGELFARSQVLSIHAPYLPGENDEMISGAELSRLPAGATLINTARGALVDEEALVGVLGERTDLYAVLDVTQPEPPPADSPLYQLDNVRLTGHVAGSIGLERRRLGRLAVDELERWCTGELLQHQVTEEQARLRA